MAPKLSHIRHDFVATKGAHYLAVCLPFYDGPRAARAYVTAARIYTRDFAFDRATGALIYGVWHGEALGASQHVLCASDVLSAALWDAHGWEWLPAYESVAGMWDKTFSGHGPKWPPPALLPPLDDSITPRNPPL